MIAVTGANGLLGSFIVRDLASKNHQVIAIKRKSSDTSLVTDIAGDIQWRNADIENVVELQEALQGATQVIHAAAMVSFNPRARKQIMDVNVGGTRNIVDLCLAENIKRLVHISSVAALGRQKDQTLIDESNKWVDGSSNTIYAESKYRAELEVFRGQEEGLSTLILNPSVILAPADWNKSSAKLFRYTWKEKPFFISGNLNYVDVRDVAAITTQLLPSKIESERYILNAGSTSFINFFTQVATRFGKKPPSVRLSKSLLKFVAGAESARSFLFRNEPLITSDTARLADTNFIYSNKKIRNSLNFSFKSIEETLDWCCDFYLNYLRKK